MQYADLPHKGSQRHGHGLPEFRATEDGVRRAIRLEIVYDRLCRVAGVNGNCTTASVGFWFPDIHLWPFDGPIPTEFDGVVLAEIFPSIFALDQDNLIQRFPDQAYHIKDAVQVRTSTEAFTGAPRGLGCRLSK